MKTTVFAFVLAMCTFTANCKTSDEVNTPFNFPFSQGDTKWKEFKTPQERIAALQIPDNSLSLISIEDLLLICLDFPYLSDVFAFNDMDIGLKAVTSKFNGLQEFLTRQNQIEVLLKVFQRISSDGLFLNANSDVEIGYNSTKICILSYLLGRPETLKKVTNLQKKNLLLITQSNIEYGHYLQSQSSGWNYLIKYGIPSLIDFHKNKNNTIFYYDRYGKSHETNKHDVHYAEIDANKRAAQYFKDKNVLFYDNTGWNYERIKPTYAVVY